MPYQPQDGPPEDLDPSPETKLEGRQPYHYPRGPDVSTERERKSTYVWMVLTAMLFISVVALVVYIADRQM